MEKQEVVIKRFEVVDIHGSMPWNKGSLTIQPIKPIVLDLEVVGVQLADGSLLIEPNELNRIVKNVRLIACAEIEAD
jgi:intein-encoded DNA endonuclease-like protein